MSFFTKWSKYILQESLEDVYNKLVKQNPSIKDKIDLLYARIKALNLKDSSSETYLQWCVKQILTVYDTIIPDGQMSKEDMLIEAVTLFEQNKQRLQNKNIVSMSYTEVKTQLSIGSNKDKKRALKAEPVQKLYEDDSIFVAQINTEEGAHQVGENTVWCTNGKNGDLFYSYNRESFIVFLLDKTNNAKYQFCVNRKTNKITQHMNSNDKPINFFELKAAIGESAIVFVTTLMKEYSKITKSEPLIESAISKEYNRYFFTERDLIKVKEMVTQKLITETNAQGDDFIVYVPAINSEKLGFFDQSKFVELSHNKSQKSIFTVMAVFDNKLANSIFGTYNVFSGYSLGSSNKKIGELFPDTVRTIKLKDICHAFIDPGFDAPCDIYSFPDQKSFFDGVLSQLAVCENVVNKIVEYLDAKILKALETPIAKYHNSDPTSSMFIKIIQNVLENQGIGYVQQELVIPYNPRNRTERQNFLHDLTNSFDTEMTPKQITQKYLHFREQYPYESILKEDKRTIRIRL